MKKIFLISILCSSFVFADAKVYIGVLGGSSSETYSKPTSRTTTSPAAKVILGYGNYKSYSIELGWIYNQNSQNYFSNNGSKDGVKYSLDLNLVKAFDLGGRIYPFFKLGIGGGYLNTDITTSSSEVKSLNFSSFDAGGGFTYLLSKSFSCELALTYKHRNYQKIDQASSGQSIASNVFTTLVGVIYRF